jgi:TorA maturation chaperone TorD
VHPPAAPDPVALALWRSAAYRFFSQALLPPDRWEQAPAAPLETVAPDPPAPADACGLPAPPPAAADALREAAAVLAGTDRGALAAAHLDTFGHVVGTRCPPYEAQYVPGGVFAQAQCAADAAGFYRAFGLEPAARAAERADHVSVELEFMHVLAYREAYARVHHGPDQVALLVDAQRGFLRDHLARWVPALARRVGAQGADPYARIAAALAAWVAADAAGLGVAVDREDPASGVEPAVEAVPEGMPGCGIACPLAASEAP